MWKSRRLIVSLVALFGLALAAYFEPTHCMRGWLWGEAFFEGRPTSYWRAELLHWKVRREPINWLGIVHTFERRPAWYERVGERWLGLAPRSHDLGGPNLLHGDPAALPVLFELLDDRSPRVRLYAQIGLGQYPDILSEQD